MAAGLSAGVAFIDILPNMAKFSAGLTSGMRRAGQSMANTGRTLTHGLTIPIALAAGASLKMSLDFQTAMTRVRTQAGASAGEVKTMSKAVLDMASSVGTGPNTLAAGLYHIESVGYRAGKALDILKTAAMGAKVGGSDLESTSSALAGVLITNIKGTGNLSHAMGILNGIVGAGNMRMGDLVQALKSGIIPTAKIAGLDLRGVGAALAMMTDEGVPATTAAQRLRTALFMLTNPTDKAKTALKSIGLNALSLGHDMQKPDGLNVAMHDLKKHLEQIHDPTKRLAILGSMFGGSRSAGTIAMLLNNLGRIKVKYDQISHVADHYNKSLEATRHTEQFKIDQAWAAIQADLIKTGSILMPMAVTLAGDITSVADAFDGLSSGTQHWIIYGALAVAALGPLLTIFGNLMIAGSAVGTVAIAIGSGLVSLAGIIPGVAVTLTEADGALIAFGAAEEIALGPIGLITIGIAGIGIAAAGIIGYLSSTSDGTNVLTGATNTATSAVLGLNAALNHAKSAHHEMQLAHHRDVAAVHQVTQAQINYNKAIHDYGKGSIQAKTAHDQLVSAEDNRVAADSAYRASVRKNRTEDLKAFKQTQKDRDAYANLTQSIRDSIKPLHNLTKTTGLSRGQAELYRQTQEHNKQVIDHAAASYLALSKADEKAADQMRKNHPKLAQQHDDLAAQAKATAELITQWGNLQHMSPAELTARIHLDQLVTIASSHVQRGGAGGHRHDQKKPKGSKAGGGGVDYGSAYIVGEVGPELFVPDVSGTIIPNHAMSSGIRGGGGGGGRKAITITNWHEGTGFIEDVADDAVNQAGRQTRRLSRMRRS